MPNLNKDQRINNNINNKTEWWLQEGGPDKRIKAIPVKLDAVWLWKRKITHPVLLNNFYVHTHREKRKEKIFDLLRFYASDSSYSTQKQTRIMAPFASHTEA